MIVDASTTEEAPISFVHPLLLANRTWVPISIQLGVAGFGDGSEFELADYIYSFHASLFFMRRLVVTRGVCIRANSYNWKHETEHWLREQTGKHFPIPNGIFIIAASYCGVKWRRAKGTPNCFFNLKMPRGSLPPLTQDEIALLGQARRLGG